MKLAELRDKSVLILGLGQEGRSTLRWLRAAFPEKPFGVADQLSLDQLSPDAQKLVQQDGRLRWHLGSSYLTSMAEYEVIVKAPGIPVNLPEYQQTLESGQRFTSHTALFFANATGTVIGVTGTKGKSTTASLIHAILGGALPDVHLAGNIGVPALDLLPQAKPEAVFVYELSSHQLVGAQQSPQIAVLLNVVPEHLDYYESFEQYVAAKENITCYQRSEDVLVYDADHAIPPAIAARSRARRVACSLERPLTSGCFLRGDNLIYRTEHGAEERVIQTSEVPLPGRFNLLNVAAALAVAKQMDVPKNAIAEAIRQFRPLEHRLERVGIFGGITYYNDSIATVPEATIAALDALGAEVETILLGGTDRHLDFSGLAKRLVASGVKTLILFPKTGERIWQALCEQEPQAPARFQHFFVESMEEAVALARQHTAPGKICLHSPASPSFGLFRDYRERGERFKQLVKEEVILPLSG
ncbi:MAG: UDP-N-acetylmuramoyl-L-alanine--D-glutamate ligase [Acidobacteria bacterium]|nr:UDP-N-acetylmuramoyl-L-alanine--D-glutamate ligase [Acidobacteriota bacterium]